jgi:hypothetical protein
MIAHVTHNYGKRVKVTAQDVHDDGTVVEAFTRVVNQGEISPMLAVYSGRRLLLEEIPEETTE